MKKPPSEAQHKARMRNWGIRNLRSLHAQCTQLTGERRTRAQAIVDEELKLRGAATTEEKLIREGNKQ